MFFPTCQLRLARQVGSQILGRVPITDHMFRVGARRPDLTGRNEESIGYRAFFEYGKLDRRRQNRKVLI